MEHDYMFTEDFQQNQVWLIFSPVRFISMCSIGFLSPEGRNTLRWSPTGSPLNLYLFYIMSSFTPLRDKSFILTDGRSFRNLQNWCFLQFSRNILNIFFQILLLILEEFLIHLLKKIKFVKSEIFLLKKFRTFFLKKKIAVFS